MGLKDLRLNDAYSTGMGDDVVNDFYIPILGCAVEYNRISGYFSSKSLAITASGINGLIQNDGVMRLLTSPNLEKKDVECISDILSGDPILLEKYLLQELDSFDLEESFTKDHVKALAWMLKNNRLEIRIALPITTNGNSDPASLFHSKIGYIKDVMGDSLTFTGSNNETGSGLIRNIEDFKVFFSWGSDKDKKCVDIDTLTFEKYWNNESPCVKTVSLPDAVHQRLLTVAPNSIDDLDLEKYYAERKQSQRAIKLYDYQKDAINSWFEAEKRGLFEMATGTGKTFTAIGCLERLLLERTSPLLIVITCPQVHLVNQWETSIRKFDLDVDVLYNSNELGSTWKDKFSDLLSHLNLGRKQSAILITTHRTFSSSKFIEILSRKKKRFEVCIVADEAHGTGAEGAQKGLLPLYDYRLALSATPRRLYDEEGTDAIFDFFGDTLYEFPLDRAITTINPATGMMFLTSYRYVPIFVNLSRGEYLDYQELSTQIQNARFYHGDPDKDVNRDILEKLLIKRANIVKNCDEKYPMFERLLSDISKTLMNTLIFVDPGQFSSILSILDSHNIRHHQFTQSEGAKPAKNGCGLSERDEIIRDLQSGKYQALVAMQCLNEGVDIPSADTGIILASSTNPREYVQRLGRLIRNFPGKEMATVYDFIVCQNLNGVRTILPSELNRARYIGVSAQNSDEILSQLYV
ncbi:DEAD/DEAH box helicase family protein [Methanorbis furvi]